MSLAANDPVLQPDAISITRGRLLEVSYFVRVTVGAGSLSSEVSVQLPIRVVNFISIDPIPSFAPSQAIPEKRRRESVEMDKRRSRSMDDVQTIRFARTVFGSGSAAPGVGIIAFDGTYRGDTTLHPVGRLEIRNFTPPEALMRRAAEQRLQELVLDPEPNVDASEESRYPHDRATKSVVADGGERQDDPVGLQNVAHAREPQVCDSAAHTPHLGDSSIEGSQERQLVSPETEHGAIPLTAYSSTATQRMYDVSQDASYRRLLPNPSASTYSTDHHATPRTSLSLGDTIDGNITSDEEVDIILGSVNPDNGSNAPVFEDSGVEVDRGEHSEVKQSLHLSPQRSPALSRDPFDVLPPVESISRSTSVRRPWQMRSLPLSAGIRQQSSVSTVASSMQSSRATSMADVDSRTSSSYSSHNSVPGTRIGGSNPAQGRPTWGASAPIARKYPTPSGGRAVIRTSQNIGPPIKGGFGGLVLQPRPLPTSRTAARRSMVTSTRTAPGIKSLPPGPAPRPTLQQVSSSDRGSAKVSPSRQPKISRLKIADLENRDDSTEPHPCDKLNIGDDMAPFAPRTFHQPTPSEDPHYIPPTVSSLMRTDIQPGNISTSTLRGPRPAPERQPISQPKDEELLEGISRSAPPLLRRWEDNSHFLHLQQPDITPTPPSRALLSMTSTSSKPFSLGPTSVKSRIAMLEEKTKSLDHTSGTMMGGRWSATSVGTGVGNGLNGVRPLSNASVGTLERIVSDYREPGVQGIA